jgi:hypothetical protein
VTSPREQARARGAVIRQVLLDILEETCAPWRTRDLRHAFGPAEYQRVYQQLQALAKAQRVLSLGEIDHTWWVASSVEPHCARCRHPHPLRLIRGLQRLPAGHPALVEGKSWLFVGGYSCPAPLCIDYALTQPWLWPEPADMGLVTA